MPAKHWLLMSFTAYYRPFRWASGVGYSVDIEYDESSVENTCNNTDTRIPNEHYVGYAGSGMSHVVNYGEVCTY